MYIQAYVAKVGKKHLRSIHSLRQNIHSVIHYTVGGGWGGHSSTLSIRVCAAKKTPSLTISLSERVCFFRNSLSQRVYFISIPLLQGYVFSEIHSKAVFVKKIFKESSTEMFFTQKLHWHKKGPHKIFLSHKG